MNEAADLVKDILNNYSEKEIKSNLISLELSKALDETQKKTFKEKSVTESEEEKKLIELIKFYKKQEEDHNLIYMDHKSWNTLPPYTKAHIILYHNPLLISGVCLAFDTFFKDIENAFKDVNSKDFSVILYKNYNYYRLTVFNNANRMFTPNSRMSASDLREFYFETLNNIIYYI